MRRLRIFGAVLVSACGEGGGDGTQSGTGTSVTTAATGSAGEGTAAPTTGGAATGGEGGTAGADATAASSSESGPGIKYDVGNDSEGTGGPAGTACAQAEALQSNQGCEFWAVDLPNAWMAQLSPAPESQTFAIVAANSASQPAEVTIYAGDGDVALQSATIPTGALYVFKFDDTYGTKNREASYGTAYRVESDYPVTVYQFNPLDNSTEVYSNDASLLFPTHVLGGDYTAVTGDGMRLGYPPEDHNAGAFVTVVATEDQTAVELFPTPDVPLYPTATKLLLDRGQTYTLVSNAVASLFQNEAGQGNLSGTRVAADKPVAVFSGNVASFEPTPQMGCCADHLEHQMLPLSAWGRAYVVVAAPPNTGSQEDPVRVRITGSFDGTQLSYAPAAPPGAPATIDAYETATFTAPAGFVVTGDQAFSVTEFLLSNEVVTEDPTPDDPADNVGFIGDPAMILVPPTAQYQSRYVFLVPAEYAENFVTIVRPAGAGVVLDGADVGGDPGWAAIGAVDGAVYERAFFSLENGHHVVAGSDDAKIGIIVVGYAPAVSYGYAGGSGVEVIGTPPPPPPPR